MNRIKKVMLGHNADNISIVVITPLPSTYKKMKLNLDVEEEFENCFFENCTFKIKNKKGLLVLSPQGMASKDIIELFENIDILFFGLAGSLNSNIEIGELVEVKDSVNELAEESNLKLFGNYKSVKCGYSPCMLGPLAIKYCDLARNMKCDVVDMETSYCAITAIEKNNRFTSLLLISDIPGVINFWEVSNDYQKKIKDKKNIAMNEIICFINRLIGGNDDE